MMFCTSGDVVIISINNIFHHPLHSFYNNLMFLILDALYSIV